MHVFLDFIKINQTIVFVIITAICLFIILSVVKRRASFSLVFLFLLFSINAGIAIDHYESIQCYFKDNCHQQYEDKEDPNTLFDNQIWQAIEDLKAEVAVEKESLHHIFHQIQIIVDQLNNQRQKVESFIEDIHSRFKTKNYMYATPKHEAEAIREEI